MSQHLHSLSVGDSVEMKGPKGHIHYQVRHLSSHSSHYTRALCHSPNDAPTPTPTPAPTPTPTPIPPCLHRAEACWP